MKFNIDYGSDIKKINERRVAEGKPEITESEQNSEITLDYISYAVNKKYPDGLDGQMRRIYGRIIKKIEDSIEKKTYKASFEEAEKDFIKKAFNEAKYPPSIAKHVNTFEDEFINKLEEEKVPKEK